MALVCRRWGNFVKVGGENMPGATGRLRLGVLVWEKNWPRSVGGVVLAEGDRGRIRVARVLLFIGAKEQLSFGLQAIDYSASIERERRAPIGGRAVVVGALT